MKKYSMKKIVDNLFKQIEDPAFTAAVQEVEKQYGQPIIIKQIGNRGVSMKIDSLQLGLLAEQLTGDFLFPEMVHQRMKGDFEKMVDGNWTHTVIPLKDETIRERFEFRSRLRVHSYYLRKEYGVG